MKQHETADQTEPVTRTADALPSCGWFDIDSFPDEGGPPKTEHCTSGKPALFRNCGFSDIPVCEDHRCRCREPVISTSSHPRPSHRDLIRALNAANAIIGQQADEMKAMQDRIDQLETEKAAVQP